MTREEARELIHEFFLRSRREGCSDIHISAGAHPFVRRHKVIYLLDDQPVLSPEAALALNFALLTPEQRDRFEKGGDLDYTYAVNENERYRTNVMRQRLGVSGSYRVVDTVVRDLRELGFPQPEVIEKLTTYHQGLILVTGPAGCGKSTTLSALVDLINRTRKDHIITVEDPIEVVHPPKSCNVTQREVGSHTRTWAAALRAALREDPDIIVIGELRDLETIEMAIRASETGHLVIGTLHTGSAASTMDRVLDVFPPNQQAMIRAMAAESLKGVICQQLLPNRDHSGVVLAVEIMLGTLAVGNIIREGETFKLPSVIQTAHNIGMCLMEESICELYMAGQLSFDQTRPKIRSEELVKRMQINEAQLAAKAAGLDKKKGWFKR
jgi:twitching motility protein PilT